ncbi:MAG: pseudouridine-5'-phosphate glycosidase [Phycisphaerales bacterium]
MKPRVALETTLLLHGVPREQAVSLNRELGDIVRARGAVPALVGVVGGVPTVGLIDAQLAAMLAAPRIPKINTASIGLAMHRRWHAATTVSATMELAAGAGIRVFATGGLGGVHRDLATRLDISADLAAFTRFPVAVVASGCKSLLDVIGTREMLETLGIPVVGFQTDRFPAFYLRDGGVPVDERFDDAADLAAFARTELARTGRGIVVCNPVPAAHELKAADWALWMAKAADRAKGQGAAGRDVTPAVLSALHEISGGKTLAANIALVKSNSDLAAQLAVEMAKPA